jgi:hypothetical protein
LGKEVVMKLLRNVTVVRANLGRGATVDQFENNVDRILDRAPGHSVFIGWQEIDEDDKPQEMRYLKKVLKDTHTIVGDKTKVPISVPKTFEVKKRFVEKVSDGVKGLQPDRFVVRALVFPEGKPDRLVNHTNVHLGRNIPELQDSRREIREFLEKDIRQSRAGWLTGDLNSHNYPALGRPERRLVTARLDYIRAYESDDVSFRQLDRGTIRLVGDGHNAHWTRLQVIWD